MTGEPVAGPSKKAKGSIVTDAGGLAPALAPFAGVGPGMEPPSDLISCFTAKLVRANGQLNLPETRAAIRKVRIITGNREERFAWPCDIFPAILRAIDAPDASRSPAIFSFFENMARLEEIALAKKIPDDLREHITAGMAARTMHLLSWGLIDSLTKDPAYKLLELARDVRFELRAEFERLALASTCKICARLFLSARYAAAYCSSTCRSLHKKRVTRLRKNSRILCFSKKILSLPGSESITTELSNVPKHCRVEQWGTIGMMHIVLINKREGTAMILLSVASPGM